MLADFSLCGLCENKVQLLLHEHISDCTMLASVGLRTAVSAE